MTEPLVYGKQLGGSCHCGSVKFECILVDTPPRKCDCSLCDLRGAVMASTLSTDLKIIDDTGLKVYQFHTRVAKHYFCGNCGIYTFHTRRSSPGYHGVNVRCLGISPHLSEVPVINGQQHMSDGYERTVSGVLKYTPSSGAVKPQLKV